MHHHWGSNYVMVSLWVFLPRDAQSNQNKFMLFLQYLKAKVRDEVDFSSADKLQRLVQIDTVILGVCGQACLNTQNNMFVISLQYFKKGRVMKLILCMQISVKVSYKLIVWFLLGMVKHSQSSQNSEFTISLQYLIKEVTCEVDFLYANKHQIFLQINFITLGIKVFCKVILKLLIGMIRHSQTTQSNKFAISLQYLKREGRDGIHFFACN